MPFVRSKDPASPEHIERCEDRVRKNTVVLF